MSTLTIRKKSLKTWLHTDSVLGDFIISKFYFNADNVSFQIVEQGQSKRVIYNITDITLYALPTGGTAETFTTITQLSLRLEQLNYPAFQYDGQITSIANLIDAGTGVTITGDGTEESPYVINSTGTVGSQTLAEVLVEGNITDGTDISISDGDKIALDNGANLKKGTTDAGLGGSKGIALRCAVDYELKWEAGRLYVMGGDGFTIREVSHNFTTTPTVTDDNTKGFVVDSRWILDNGDVYVCTDATTGASAWELQGSGTIPTLQDVTTEGNETTNNIKVKDSEKSFTLQTNGILFQDIDDGGTTLLRFDNTSVTDQEVLIRGLSGTMALTSDIPKSTSELTNDGADGINPFITALDIPTTSQASTLVREVKNMTGATLTKGTVVYISGANGNKPLVSKAIATTDALSARTFGLLQSDISNNGLGNCVIIGDLSGLDTSSFAEGAQLYLSGVTAGTYTSTRTLAPTHLVYVGKVTRSHPTLGQIEVGIQNGYELEEIHDCQIIIPLDNQALTYETSTDLWKNKTIIEDSITNGVTTIAPSQNAVFDALALKQNILSYTPYRNIQTSQTAHTGTTAETVLFTATIPAGAFNSNDIIKVLFGANKTTALGSYTLRLRVNTTNTISGAPTIATYNGSASIQANVVMRNYNLNGGNLYGVNFATTAISDIFAGAGVSSTTLNPANQFFIFGTVTLANASDSIIGNMFSIHN